MLSKSYLHHGRQIPIVAAKERKKWHETKKNHGKIEHSAPKVHSFERDKCTFGAEC